MNFLTNSEHSFLFNLLNNAKESYSLKLSSLNKKIESEVQPESKGKLESKALKAAQNTMLCDAVLRKIG